MAPLRRDALPQRLISGRGISEGRRPEPAGPSRHPAALPAGPWAVQLASAPGAGRPMDRRRAAAGGGHAERLFLSSLLRACPLLVAGGTPPNPPHTSEPAYSDPLYTARPEQHTDDAPKAVKKHCAEAIRSHASMMAGSRVTLTRRTWARWQIRPNVRLKIFDFALIRHSRARRPPVRPQKTVLLF